MYFKIKLSDVICVSAACYKRHDIGFFFTAKEINIKFFSEEINTIKNLTST